MLVAVEQNHRQTVAEFGSQRAVAGGCRGVDVDEGQLEVEFGGQLDQPVVDPLADAASGAAQQLDVCAAHASQCRS